MKTGSRFKLDFLEKNLWNISTYVPHIPFRGFVWKVLFAELLKVKGLDEN